MTRRPKQPPPRKTPAPDAVLQIKVWLLGISPMVWRRLLVPSSYTLRELHSVIQVAMGGASKGSAGKAGGRLAEGGRASLYDFALHAARYGSWELAFSPDATLASLRLRKGARFIYEYDLNIPWRHEVRIEDQLPRETGKIYPVCSGGSGACAPEDCGGPQNFMVSRDERFSFDALEDWSSTRCCCRASASSNALSAASGTARKGVFGNGLLPLSTTNSASALPSCSMKPARAVLSRWTP